MSNREVQLRAPTTTTLLALNLASRREPKESALSEKARTAHEMAIGSGAGRGSPTSTHQDSRPNFT